MLFSGFVVMLLVLFSALIGCGVANFFLDRESARIAGFSFSIGNLSSLMYVDQAGLGQLPAVVGAITGLLLVWYLFFRENRFAVDDSSKQKSAE